MKNTLYQSIYKVSSWIAILALCAFAASCGGDDDSTPDASTATDASTADAAAVCTPSEGASLLNVPAQGLGSATCDTCSKSSCACEYEAMEASPQDSPTIQSLLGCANTSCQAECNYQVCDSNLALGLFSGCSECLGTSCCDLAKTCIGEGATPCLDCLNGAGAACEANTDFTALQSCYTASCNGNETCGQLLPQP